MFKNILNLLLSLPKFIKFCVHYPKTVLCLLLMLASWVGYQRVVSQSDVSFKGLPQAQSTFNHATKTTLLKSSAFSVGYSETYCNPLWVAYRLQKMPENAPHLPRPTHFTVDKRTECKIAANDYQRSGYDRGHLAPNHAISTLYGKAAQLETFKLSNIAPQKPKLNRKWWQRLEAVEAEHFTQQYATVWVLTGTIFDTEPNALSSAPQVKIPRQFYKVYAGVDVFAQPHFLAFLVPQTVKGNEPLSDYLVSVDAVEAASGLDFFSQLNDKAEAKLEAAIESADWKLDAVNNTPSRF